jgi:hypothetical protein
VCVYCKSRLLCCLVSGAIEVLCSVRGSVPSPVRTAAKGCYCSHARTHTLFLKYAYNRPWLKTVSFFLIQNSMHFPLRNQLSPISKPLSLSEREAQKFIQVSTCENVSVHGSSRTVNSSSALNRVAFGTQAMLHTALCLAALCFKFLHMQIRGSGVISDAR